VFRFARFLRAEDSRHELPPPDLFHQKQSRPTPRILTAEEVGLAVAHSAHIGSPATRRSLVYPTLFGLLASTGLRSGEVIRLRLSDVQPEGLLVRESKFRKSRLVPLHPTVRSALDSYLEVRRNIITRTDHVFVSRLRRPFNPASLHRVFKEACRRAGVRADHAEGAPRIHDLRHSFAVRALQAAPCGRDNVERHMVALTTYMGHAKVVSTYWYLESAPELLKDIAQACEALLERERA
jgi:integrase